LLRDTEQAHGGDWLNEHNTVEDKVPETEDPLEFRRTGSAGQVFLLAS
jgi:hypothetical protein